MARKLAERKARYIAGSVVTKEEISPRRKTEKKVRKTAVPKKGTKRNAKVLKNGTISREDRARILREREMGHSLQQERLQGKASANFALAFSVAFSLHQTADGSQYQNASY